MGAELKITGRATPVHCQQCDAVIGMIVVRNRVRRLLLFAPGSSKVMAEIKGDATIYCANCGIVRNWWEDKQSIIKDRLQMEDEEQHGC